MATDKGSKLNPKLDRVLKDLLNEVTKKTADPAEAPSLTDKMKVIDRVLKWEQIKGNLNDGEWGSGFSNE